MLLKIFATLLLINFLMDQSAFGEFETLIEGSIGTDAISYQHSPYLGFQFDVALVDGSVTTQPGDSTVYDRTALNYTKAALAFPLNPKWGTRLSLWGKKAYRKEEGATEPRKITSEEWLEGRFTAEMVFFTQNNLELFLGVSVHVIPEYSRMTETTSVSTETDYSGVSIPIPHIGVVKRSGFVEGGFYYKQGAEKGRKVTKRTVQETQTEEEDLVFDEVVHEATEVAMFFKLDLGQSYFFGEFASVQGSEGGNKTDGGDTVTEDYFRMRSTLFVPVGFVGIKATLIYKPLSYASNSTVTMETIPMTAMHLKLVIEQGTFAAFGGVIYGYGSDGQSLTEFNADYEVQAFGGSVGFNLFM